MIQHAYDAYRVMFGYNFRWNSQVTLEVNLVSNHNRVKYYRPDES